MTKHPTTTVAGDIGRRIAMRREELGLSAEDVAAHAYIDLGYLRYVEQDCTAAPGVATLRGLAMALDSSVSALSGGEADLPPGRGQAAGTTELVGLGGEECWKPLSTHGVGRLVLSMPDGLTVLPVNYCVTAHRLPHLSGRHARGSHRQQVRLRGRRGGRRAQPGLKRPRPWHGAHRDRPRRRTAAERAGVHRPLGRRGT